ncbi:MAG: type II toxin-antitoxin system PemK/MazF family toxin [Firmicutes bacterium]|nr:type II toxin-antitoxin system PemK/MazF family toxin [Bacillota bacterium]
MIQTEESIVEKALKNFTIVKNSDSEKFKQIDEWLLKESRLYMKEIKNNNAPAQYYSYKRGTILKVDFGVNPGSELCYTHFAIVLDKDNKASSDSITVVPLTSKEGQGKILLDTLILDELIKKLSNKVRVANSEADVQKIKALINSYKKYTNFSYAYVSQITTISKSRIIIPSNKYDIIGKSRCSKEILNKIDNEIIKLYTNLNDVDKV